MVQIFLLTLLGHTEAERRELFAEAVATTGRFDFEKLSQHGEWLKRYQRQRYECRALPKRFERSINGLREACKSDFHCKRFHQALVVDGRHSRHVIGIDLKEGGRMGTIYDPATGKRDVTKRDLAGANPQFAFVLVLITI